MAGIAINPSVIIYKYILTESKLGAEHEQPIALPL
jgi:hypothetical protein